MAVAPAESPKSARELAKQETREALVQAAIAEFAEKGLDLPSLDAICARAGFTRGAFYVHFRDREELLGAVMERALGAHHGVEHGVEDALHHRAEELLAVAEVDVEGAAREAGALTDGIEARRIQALFGEQLERGADERLARPLLRL
ncbi:MAG TPA: TetR family transcriptional regulator, partial [Myxococcota bacterium]|nr:TetR family transcriptional regulator [Myxococcota bacterium]